MSFTGILKKASNLILRSQSETQPSTFNTEGEVIFCEFKYSTSVYVGLSYVFIFKVMFTFLKYFAHLIVLLS